MLYQGSDGAWAQREAIEELGGTVERQYTVIGRYDVVVVADLPDDATSLAIFSSRRSGRYVCRSSSCV